MRIKSDVIFWSIEKCEEFKKQPFYIGIPCLVSEDLFRKYPYYFYRFFKKWRIIPNLGFSNNCLQAIFLNDCIYTDRIIYSITSKEYNRANLYFGDQNILI